MGINYEKKFVPRDGRKLIVVLIARISGCAKQKEISLEDQLQHLKEFVEDFYSGPVEYIIIATKGKGENKTRAELIDLEAKLNQKFIDVLIMEDLGRLLRGVDAVRLLGVAHDNGTRGIALGDNIDTAEITWEADAAHKTADHIAHQVHTSRRIKSRFRIRFLRNGECTGQPIAGYIVDEGVKSYDQWKKDALAEQWIREAFVLLRATLNCAVVAAFLNDNGIPTGPSCRVNKKWTGRLVREYFGNPLLKGMARHNNMISEKRYLTGIRSSVRNTEEPLYYACPHLAFLTEAEFDDLNQALDQKNKNLGRKPVGQNDPRYRVPRSRTKFPGQHALCWYCGHPMYWGGNGVNHNLMCSNSRHCNCWNTIGFNGKLATQRVVEAVIELLWKLPDLEAQFRELLDKAALEQPTEIELRWRKLEADEQAWRDQKSFVNEAAKKHGTSMLDEAIEALKIEKTRIDLEREHLEGRKKRDIKVACSLDDLRLGLQEQLTNATFDCPKFGLYLRKLCPEFHVFNVRRCDDEGHILPRARIRLSLSGMLDIGYNVPGLDELLSSVSTVDLFESTQTVRIMEEVARLAASGLQPKEIATQIEEHPTTTAVHNALNLHKRMTELGLSSPYVVLREPPADYAKLRRHKNSKYDFKPQDGYIAPELD
jgi:site-specific DNA recombinase